MVNKLKNVFLFYWLITWVTSLLPDSTTTWGYLLTHHYLCYAKTSTDYPLKTNHGSLFHQTTQSILNHFRMQNFVLSVVVEKMYCQVLIKVYSSAFYSVSILRLHYLYSNTIQLTYCDSISFFFDYEITS